MAEIYSDGAAHDRYMGRWSRYVAPMFIEFAPIRDGVEQPKKFELLINLSTAKQIGLTIPQKVPARADRVIR